VSGRLAVRCTALGYLALLLLLPLGLVFYRTFEQGLTPVWDELTSSAFVHALKLTLIITLIVVPVNTIFGVACALAIVRRGSSRTTWLVQSAAALPLALSPVVIGLALLLVYGQNERFGGWLVDHGIRVIFALPGMVLATIFVTVPFVVREVVPVLREVGTDQEEAAWTLGASRLRTFWRITLPAIRWGIAYGVVLTTARALGEFGAVAVVSGRLVGQTETLTLHVEERFESFDAVGAYTSSVVLAVLAVLTLVGMNLFKPRLERKAADGDLDSPGHEALR
jgi:sulfate/thiosulfate transport system permease protein